MNHTILAIESSCDETAAAVYSATLGIRSSTLYSQIALHAHYGGVVPEIASRSHLEKIGPIVHAALQEAGISLSDTTAIAVTNRPGLPGSLLVGLSFAKALAWSLNKPILGINHLEGHIFSACIEQTIPFPFLCITASGGHTALYFVEGFGQFTLLGQTLDDAAGEAFDKIAKLLGLGYPGGPIIETLAGEADFIDYFGYPRPMQHSLDFSFSGLKTAVLYDLIKRNAYDLEEKKFSRPDDTLLKQQVASSLLVGIADIFQQKLRLALKNYPAAAIVFVGGVACNKYIRNRLSHFADTHKLPYYSPLPKYCTDNAAMIAYVAHYRAQQEKYDDIFLDIDFR